MKRPLRWEVLVSPCLGWNRRDGSSGGHSGACLSPVERHSFPSPEPCGIYWASWTVEIKGNWSVLVSDFSALGHSRRQHLRQGSALLQVKTWRKANGTRGRRLDWTNAQQSGRWAKIPAWGGYFTSVLELRRAKSQHNLETNHWLFSSPYL